jgi:cytochrome oxidase assembly protein ShyY1
MRVVKEVAITILALLLIYLCSIAALWQFHKGENRTRENQKISQNISLPPAQVNHLADIEYSKNTWERFTIFGRFDEERMFLARDSYNNGEYGFEVFNRFSTPSGEKIWIDRGWVRAPASASLAPQAPEPTHLSEVITIRLRNSQESKKVGGSLYATSPVSGHNFPVTGYYGDLLDGRVNRPLTQIQLPDLTTGPHYAYSLQWLLFALVILVGRIELLRRSVFDLRR